MCCFLTVYVKPNVINPEYEIMNGTFARIGEVNKNNFELTYKQKGSFKEVNVLIDYTSSVSFDGVTMFRTPEAIFYFSYNKFFSNMFSVKEND